MATEVGLGVRPSRTYSFIVIMSPVGGYFYDASRPMRIRVEDRQVRAVEGGMGSAKTGGNYAASLVAAEAAHADGFDQVLWLDGRERRYLDEVGTMNLMLRLGDEVVTPPLGTILDGVTRDTCLTLLRDWGIETSERRVSIDEVMEASRAGQLREAWGTGTAASVQAIGELSYQGESTVINDGEPGEITQRLASAIRDVQYGRADDRHGWLLAV
jgi:branched-chain amino acid aminotransferase